MRRSKRIGPIELPKEDPQRIAIQFPVPAEQPIPVSIPRREEVSVPTPTRIEPKRVEK
jgi:hypothetical protein